MWRSRVCAVSGLSLIGLNDMAFAVHPHAAKLDAHLHHESAKWEKVLTRFGNKEMDEMHITFIQKCGGTTNEKEIEENKKKAAAAPEERILTHEKQNALSPKGSRLPILPKKRGQTLGTIISHLEKIEDGRPDI